ncbi:hypothetical protein AZE42_01066 [Rhizopogon vesiculosus]|uniref:ATPase AAA-type core domain-containing protein n=1 Tax=Rhizopogon vesiculosus TaxID=180088 RepID=A0A1J8Q8E1_9AGAM|nr:hypothetical protein AZE42_01066 [Rhizopogon vesiculosus]
MGLTIDEGGFTHSTNSTGLSSISVHTRRAKATSVTGRPIPDDPEEELDQLPTFVCGFELKNKFDENARDHLVIDEDVKDSIKGLVDITTNANTSQYIISDATTGKGGDRHGPPGTGKTLRAEAVAKHLKRPLCIIGSIELSPSTLESRLSGILSLATTWDAVVLIDEAHMFPEEPS